jgi:hypothetical protein
MAAQQWVKLETTEIRRVHRLKVNHRYLHE